MEDKMLEARFPGGIMVWPEFYYEGDKNAGKDWDYIKFQTKTEAVDWALKDYQLRKKDFKRGENTNLNYMLKLWIMKKNPDGDWENSYNEIATIHATPKSAKVSRPNEMELIDRARRRKEEKYNKLAQERDKMVEDFVAKYQSFFDSNFLFYQNFLKNVYEYKDKNYNPDLEALQYYLDDEADFINRHMTNESKYPIIRRNISLHYDVPFIDEIKNKISTNDLYSKQPTNKIEILNEDRGCAIVDFKFFLVRSLDGNYPLNEIKTLFTTKLNIIESVEYDILVIDIISPQLNELNAIFRNYLEIDNYKKYEPCYEIAYLKKGCGEKYLNLINLNENILAQPYKWTLYQDGHKEDILKEECKEILTESKSFQVPCNMDIKETYLFEFVKSSLSIRHITQFIENEFDDVEIKPDKEHPDIIKVFFNKENKENVEDVTKKLKAYGWFPNDKEYTKIVDDLLNDKIEKFEFSFEPHYPRQLTANEASRFWYHVTPTNVWLNKIKKIGLCPKSQSQRAIHPERIYLFDEDIYTTTDDFIFLGLNKNKGKNNKKEEYSVLKITPKDLISKIKFYKDPYSEGYFTYDNIPPEYIKEIRREKLGDDWMKEKIPIEESKKLNEDYSPEDIEESESRFTNIGVIKNASFGNSWIDTLNGDFYLFVDKDDHPNEENIQEYANGYMLAFKKRYPHARYDGIPLRGMREGNIELYPEYVGTLYDEAIQLKFKEEEPSEETLMLSNAFMSNLKPNENGMVQLVHYSSAKITDYFIKIGMSPNSHSLHDMRTFTQPRSYFWAEGKVGRDPSNSGKYIYYSEIPFEYIYDIQNDPQGLGLTKATKKYNAVAYNLGSKPTGICVVAFINLPILKIKPADHSDITYDKDWNMIENTTKVYDNKTQKYMQYNLKTGKHDIPVEESKKKRIIISENQLKLLMEQDYNVDYKELFKPVLDLGYHIYMVGGSVRDNLMGTESNDIDLTTDCPLDKLMELMKGHKIDPAGIKFGHVNIDGFDIGEFREDLYDDNGGDGRHPIGIVKSDTIYGDLSRRDFTINAIAKDNNGEYIDPFGGVEDLKNKIIRFVGDPKDKLKQDNLRALRAFRFASRYGFSFDPATWDALSNHTSLQGVSDARIGEEFKKIIVSKDAPRILRLMAESGILYTIIPELQGQLMDHNNPHHSPTNILEHTFRVFTDTCAKTGEYCPRMAALLHDIGKPVSYQEKPDKSYSYVGHDKEGAKIAEAILRRLRNTKAEIDTIIWIIENHMKATSLTQSKKKYKQREFVGHKYFNQGLPVFDADSKGAFGKWYNEIKQKYGDNILPPPEVTAKDLIAKGEKPGPKLGEKLRNLYIQQLNRDPEVPQDVVDNVTNEVNNSKNKKNIISENNNKIKNKSLLKEGLTPIVYHFTTVNNLVQILEQNKMLPSEVVIHHRDSVNEPLRKGYSGEKYISFSRTKSSNIGYATSTHMLDVRMTFDGDKLNNNYYAKPFNYGDSSVYDDNDKNKHKTKNFKDFEYEDRLFLKDGTDGIKNISKYILRIDILTPSNPKYSKIETIKEIIDFCKDLNIPLYIYDKRSNFNSGNDKTINNIIGTNYEDLPMDEGKTTTKKIILSEAQIKSLRDYYKNGLPNIVRKGIYDKKTSLGDNPCFPPETDEKIEIKLLTKAYEQILSELNKIYKDTTPTIEEAKNILSKLLNEVYDLEKGIKPHLEKVVLNIIQNIFEIDTKDVDLTVSLVDRITSDDIKLPLQPESTDDVEFDTIEDLSNTNDDVYKRRVVNCLMNGIASKYLTLTEFWINNIYKINPDLIPLYKKIYVLNNYINFNDDANIYNENKMTQGSTSNVVVKSYDRSVIDVKAINFVALLYESVRAILDLISFNGLPQDRKKIKFVLKKADFLLANKWDERFGQAMWSIIESKLDKDNFDNKLIPYLFYEIISKPVNDFNIMLQNIFANTKQGRIELQSLVDGIQYKLDKENFDQELDDKRQEIITDDYDPLA
jgi:putative nucleotidyltransferase with HDIG domain